MCQVELNFPASANAEVGKQDTLPDFVKIVATEPVKFDKTSPIQHLRPPRSQHRGASSTSGTGVTDPSLTDSTPPPAQSLIETGFERTIGFVDFVSGYDVEQAYNAIQATLPSKQLIRHLRDFGMFFCFSFFFLFPFFFFKISWLVFVP